MELLAHYSRSPVILYDLRMVLQVTAGGVSQTAEPPSPVSQEPANVASRVRDRLSTDNITDIIAAGRAGVPMVEIARQFKISGSSVKRILRKHGVSNGPGNYKRS